MTESVWDYPRPPRLEPTTRHLVVSHHGQVIADSRAGWRVLETSHPPVFYLPRADVRDLLTESGHRTFCEFKGVATYWNLDLPDGTVANAAWSYEEPTTPYAAIAGAVAFHAGKVDRCLVDDEVVTPQPGGFYGGWITADVVGPFKS